jgi:hypothetical protein
MRKSFRSGRTYLSVGLAVLMAAGSVAAPAEAASSTPGSVTTVLQPRTIIADGSPSLRPAQKPAGPAVATGAAIAFSGAKTSSPVAVRLADPPGGWNPPTLTIDGYQPSLPIEGQPLQLSFHVRNNSTAFPLSGTVLETGNGQDAFGGVMAVSQLAPGATISGVVADNAPTAGKNVGIGLSFTGNLEDGTPAPGLGGGVTCSNCGGTPTYASALTNLNIAAMFVVSLDSFHVNSTRGIPDADYVGLTSFAQGPGISNGYPATWGPSNVANGDDRRVGIATGPYAIVPDDSVALGLAYGIVSDLSGSSAAATIGLNNVEWDTAVAIGNTLESSGRTAGEISGIPAGGDPSSSPAWLALSSQIPFSYCDGVVAQDEFAVSGTELMRLTATGPHTETHTYVGPEFGCGGAGPRSSYDVTWTITRG